MSGVPEEFILKLTREQLEGLETAFFYAWRDMTDQEYGPADSEDQAAVGRVESVVVAQVRAGGWETFGL